MSEEDWTREAVRLHGRYQREIVEGCGLCPWAIRARLDGKVRERVLLQVDSSIEASLAAIWDYASDLRAEVVFLVYPRLDLRRRDFDEFAARVRDADSHRHELGRVPFVSASFHPEAEPDTAHAERFIPFLRRTPDPTIQFLRASALDAVRGGTSQGTQFLNLATFEASIAEHVALAPPLRERIAKANLATARKMGIDTLRERLDELRRDRNETYRALEAREARAVDRAVTRA